MAVTGYARLRSTNIGGYNFNFDGRIEAEFGRTNNTLHVQMRTWIRVAGDSAGASFSGYSVDGHGDMPDGSRRINQYLANAWSRNQERATNWAWFDVGVGADQTGISVRPHVSVNGGSGSAYQEMGIPALGAPAGTTYFNSRTDTSLNVRNDVTNWGAYATAGSVRSYRADNAAFTGQTYISTSDNANVNHTGLTPNKQYWFRGWSDNGGGKSAYMSTINNVTLANGAEVSKEVLATTVSFSLTATQGYRTTSTKVQYRKLGDATWIDSTAQDGGTPTIELTGLPPNTEYEYRLAVTTTEGTWEGAVQTLTTLPAGKLIYPDGTVKNAIPRLVKPDGSPAEMINISLVDPL